MKPNNLKEQLDVKVKGNPRIIKGWVFYDWANSVYPLVVTSTIFPIFYNAVTSVKDDSGNVIDSTINFLGYSFENTQLYTFVISLAFLIVSFASPILSGIADYSGNKKSFLKFFCYLGAGSVAGMFFFGDLFKAGFIGISLLLILLASVGFWGSLVFYNAYLPEIAEPKDHDRISSRGFNYGYVGSSILLIICLILIQGIDVGLTKYCFLLTGLWWIGFSQYTYARLPDVNYKKNDQKNKFTKGFKELLKVQKQLRSHPYLGRFLTSFFVYSMGLQTVFVIATPFADKELGIETGGMIVSILVIQFVAVAGSLLFSRLSEKYGNIYSLSISLVIWTIVCFSAYFFLDGNDPQVQIKFYVFAAVIGLVMGGVQALSRSTYSKLLPETEDHASFFSFYDITEKIGIVIGTLTWGLLEGSFGSMKIGLLSLALFFIVGLFLLFRVPNKIFVKN
jgi:MFS transporter, UMF1 family